MTFRFKEGSENKLATQALVKMPAQIRKGIRRGAYITGKQLVADTRDKMTRGSRSGKTYKVYSGLGGRRLSSPRIHRASGANEYPGVISGRLRDSVDFKVRGSDSLEFGAGNNTVKYAKFLETGTSKIAPRKYLKQTINRLQNQTKTNLSRELNKSIRSLGFKVNKI
jgi:HK97 gp10 family phage protein